MDNNDASFAEKMIFDANLQEFAARVGFICSLEAQEKITQAEAYSRIKGLWKDLKRSKKNLNIDNEP
ncbi:MAG: hypothetical protein ACF8CQ_07040 [Rhodopirellula sp. JB044]|uniref:DUF7219 family protein n=1 Tax=Rhodopirellula sp. JB044 TaxID=3342844 RepID=UPI00370AE9B8